MEYLAAAGFVVKTIKAYITVIKRFHLQMGVTLTATDSFEVKKHLAGLDRSLNHRVCQAQAISPTELSTLLLVLQQTSNPQPFIFAFTLAYTTFIRQANLPPPSEAAFDPARHTSRQDIVKTKHGFGLRVFWTKTRQSSTVPEVIPLPDLKGHILCPSAAWRAYKKLTKGADKRGPLLVFGTPGNQKQFEVISLPLLNEVFRLALSRAGMHGHFTLHSLRRGGSLACYKEGASVPDLMHHGTWASDAIWAYLARESAEDSSVMTAWEKVAGHTQPPAV